MNAQRWRSVLPLLVLGLAFSLRLYHLDFQSIWWDEGHSIFVASHPLSRIATLPAMDVHPPAYFSLLHLWLGVTGLSTFALRYFSVVWSMLAVALLWRIARTIAGCSRYPSALQAALLAALSPLYVAYAQEVRSYAMLTFLALASTFSLGLLLWRARPGRQRVLLLSLYILATAACLYTHYFTLFLLLFHNLAWLAWTLRAIPQPVRLKERVSLWLGSQAALLLLFTPQLLLALRQVTSYTNPNLAPPSLLEFIIRSWQAYTVGLTIGPEPARLGMLVVAGVLLASLVALVLKTVARVGPGRRPDAGPVLFLFGWFLLPLAAYFLVLQRQPSFEPRYLILVTPALFLLLALGPGWGLDKGCVAPFRFPLSALRNILYALPILVFSLSLYSYYTDETYFKDDSAGVAAWLAAETTPADIIYVDVPHPFHYYAEQGHIAAPVRYLFVDIHTAADILNRETAGQDRLFWVTWRGSDTDPRGVIPFLLNKYGQPLGQRDFRGYHVEWFKLPGQGTQFSLPVTLAPIQATFGNVLRLDGAAYGGFPPSEPTVSPGHPVWATLHFTLLQQTGVDYRVSLRLQTESGVVVAQIDRDLLNDRHFRTSGWPVADPALNQALNVYTLPLPPDIAPGTYRLAAVIYNARPPYPSEGVRGAATADGTAAFIGQVTVTP